MPQMMPMNWIMLFMYTLSLFLMFNIQNYFSLSILSKNFKNQPNFKKTNWMW